MWGFETPKCFWRVKGYQNKAPSFLEPKLPLRASKLASQSLDDPLRGQYPLRPLEDFEPILGTPSKGQDTEMTRRGALVSPREQGGSEEIPKLEPLLRAYYF